MCYASESLAGGDPVGDLSKTVRVKGVGARRGYTVRISLKKMVFVHR
jgi:hypothetical protein